jgi:hypothetical protein
MKHWNRQKRYRLAEWVSLDIPLKDWHNAKLWCQQHSSPSKFYTPQYGNTWWFENSEDALAFKLVWMNK